MIQPSSAKICFGKMENKRHKRIKNDFFIAYSNMYNLGVIKNITNGKIISNEIKFAKGFLDTALGMLRKRNSEGIIFKTRFGIHTFMMGRPIDVLITDKNKIVRRVKESLSPNRIFFWDPQFDTVIELRQGSIKKSKTKAGDYLDF
jgi:uncharacterized membrane protein (UPF0127 family)